MIEIMYLVKNSSNYYIYLYFELIHYHLSPYLYINEEVMITKLYARWLDYGLHLLVKINR